MLYKGQFAVNQPQGKASIFHAKHVSGPNEILIQLPGFLESGLDINLHLIPGDVSADQWLQNKMS